MSVIVICEKKGEWARQLRRLSYPYSIQETRSLEDCSHGIQTHPGCLAALEVDPVACQRVAEWIWRIRERHPQTAVVVMVPPGCGELGWCLRQSGAAHVISSTLELRRSKRLIERHLSRFHELPLSLEQRIWNNLPWRASRADDTSRTMITRGDVDG